MLKWLWLSLLIVIADQLSKYWVVTNLKLGQKLTLLPFLELTYTHNPGVAFGMGQDGGWWAGIAFLGIPVVVAIIILNWLRKLEPEEKWLAVGLSMVLGGAGGNIIDRVMHTDDIKRGVVDFIHVYIGSNDYFPWIFNIADAMISIGVVLILFYEIFLRRKHTQRDENEPGN